MKWYLFQISITGIITFKPVGVADIIRLWRQTRHLLARLFYLNPVLAHPYGRTLDGNTEYVKKCRSGRD